MLTSLGQYRLSEIVVPAWACPDMAANTIIDVARMKRFAIMALLLGCLMRGRDARLQDNMVRCAGRID
jgi:hypothetical protein